MDSERDFMWGKNVIRRQKNVIRRKFYGIRLKTHSETKLVTTLAVETNTTNQTIRVMTTRQVYQEILNDYRTTASKKAALTRCAKEVREYIADLEEALGRGKDHGAFREGMLLGERVTDRNIEYARFELRIIAELREQL